MQINMDLKEMLPKIRAARDAMTLQMNGPKEEIGPNNCKYVGPCAIGVCMTEEEQIFCDSQNRSALHSLIEEGIVIFPEEQKSDALSLQLYHDNAVHTNYDRRYKQYPLKVSEFDDFLSGLEVKYGIR